MPSRLVGPGKARNDRPNRVLIGGYYLVKSLKEGGMSQGINLVKSKTSGNKYIEKHAETDRLYRRRAETEIRALKRVDKGHLNLNQLHTYKWFTDLRVCSVLLEYCDEGSGEDLINSHIDAAVPISEDFLWHIFASLANALAFLHHGVMDPLREADNPRWDYIYHLDIKPCNFFLTSRARQGRFPRVVLGDFGCSVSASDVDTGRESSRQQPFGTPDWYPPEGLVNPQNEGRTSYGKMTDIWQLGATIHVACRLGEHPNRGHLEFADTVLGSARVQYSLALAKTVFSCAHPRKNKRPSALELAALLSNKPIR
ncbi:kinase-like protein [Polychaeton citri CBS 116435]|uniref:non-specific serine/threonine protein kinase n=1 Tax=Polychaeton citri CBS 116435 TaxID=1314669 RepID=A0A9P4PX51_9PEZI|nr:kinase-like protein [Polychaeton citri CBS 116435]